MRYTIVLAIILLATCCSTPNKVTNPTDWKGRSLHFGSGGGFTGSSTIYTLLENGQLFSETGVVKGPVKELDSVKKKKVKPLFASAAKINWGEENITQPGNMYSALMYKENGKEHKVIWGDGKYTPPADIQQLYKDLNSILPPKK